MAVIIGADGHQYLTVRVLQCRVLRSVERCNAESRVSHPAPLFTYLRMTTGHCWCVRGCYCGRVAASCPGCREAITGAILCGTANRA